MASQGAVTITKDNFAAEVEQFDGVVLVDFWASWCGPCRAMNPRLEALAAKYKGDPRVKIGAVDVDAESEFAQENQIMSIPTYKIYAGGEFVTFGMGLIAPDKLEALLQTGLAKLSPATEAAAA